MKPFEKRAILRFSTIYSLAFGALFALLAFLYYYEQRDIVIRESVVKQRIAYRECIKMQENDCQSLLKLQPVDTSPILRHIAVGFLIALGLIIPFSIGLAWLSLRPIRRATVMMDDFIAHVVHDINTPLSVIKLNAASLRTKIEPPNRKKLERIQSSATQLENMQHALLALLKSEEGRLAVQEIDPAGFLEPIVHNFRQRFPNVLLNVDLADAVIVRADPKDLQRIVENILSNAFKYNRDNRPIDLVMDQKDLFIRDRGVGMHHPERIFEKYYREKTSLPGSGLGMSAVAAMCKRNRIGITVRSKPGHGTEAALHFE